jgi:hypothetical protein
VNKDVEKTKLQNLMAFGTELAPQPEDQSYQIPNNISRRKASDDQISRFEERETIFAAFSIFCYITYFYAFTVMEDVRDRCQFLQDVAELGQAEKYKTIMENEIAAKLAIMKAIDPVQCDEFRHQINLPLNMRLPLKKTSARIHH